VVHRVKRPNYVYPKMAIKLCVVLVIALLGAYGPNNPHFAAAQQLSDSDIQCEGTLVTLSSQLTSTCCEQAANCEDGTPTTCSAACSALWMPFYQQCSTFIAASLPMMSSFSSSCQSSSTGAPSTGAPVSGQDIQYLTVTLQVTKIPSSAKKLNRFLSEFRQDLAASLSIDEKLIILTEHTGAPKQERRCHDALPRSILYRGSP
jgi:hypothetical protein